MNEPVLGAVLSALKGLSGKVQAAPPTLDGILSLKGVIEVTEEDESEEEHRAAETAIISGFGEALAALLQMRQAEGKTLGRLLSTRLDELAVLDRQREEDRRAMIDETIVQYKELMKTGLKVEFIEGAVNCYCCYMV